MRVGRLAGRQPSRAACPHCVLLVLGRCILAVPPPAAAETMPTPPAATTPSCCATSAASRPPSCSSSPRTAPSRQRELWRSKKGAFDTRKATFVAGDVNGDGIADGIALYDLGGGRSRLLVYRSDGITATAGHRLDLEAEGLREGEGQARRRRPRP